MDHQVLSDWNASWIWGSGSESPRNEWRCFRRSFTPKGPVEQASVRLTADSRYILFVNGRQAGRGPVRSWPFELYYDEYDIGHLLRPNQENIIAVLVIHYGVSTFQYLRGRGGLLLQVEIGDETLAQEKLLTNTDWKTFIHQGHDPRTSRISCQLGFTEVVDARMWDDSWIRPGYDDSDWETATIIGPAGMEPWTKLTARTIPYLTEEPLYPSRVDSLWSVKSPSWSAVLDLRNLMVPDSANHANNVRFYGYLATVIRLEQPAVFTLGIVDHGRIESKISINGHHYDDHHYTGEDTERYLSVSLQNGDHFILIDVSGQTHGHGFHIGFDCEESFEVMAPEWKTSSLENNSQQLASRSAVPFVQIGPFDSIELIDHQPGRELRKDHPHYNQISLIATAHELQTFQQWIQPIDPQLVNMNDVFTSSVWKIAEIQYPVQPNLQHAVIAGPNAATIPIYDGMDTEIVIDFGRELSGYISFDLHAAEGTMIDGYGFEYMKDGWRQHTYQLDNTFRYTCKEARQSYTSSIRRGLRYLALTIRGAKKPVKLYEVKLIQSNYPVSNIGQFRSSDPLLNDVWDISRDTTRLCMEDTFVDCPAFEQAYWVGDARNEALVNYYAFGARDIVEHCLKLVPGSSFQTPLYSDQVPSGWNSVIPNWTFFWVTACLEYYRYDGNHSFIADIWPHIKLTLEQYLTLLNDQGLLEREGWNLLDWAPFEQPATGIVTPQNMFLVKALYDAAEIGVLAGDPSCAKHFIDHAKKLRESINDWLWDEKRTAYLDCIHSDGSFSSTISMQSQVVAYLCNIAEGERIEIIEQYLVNPPVSFVQVGSPFMSFFFYEALAKLGRFDILMSDMHTNYGLMIEHGATTCWEMYPWSDQGGSGSKMLTRSHCHAWSAGPVYFLGAYVLGVQGVTPGWTKVRIAPQPCGLLWAKGSVPLPHDGRINISWRITHANQLHLRIEAPKHIELLPEAPEGYKMTIEIC